MDYLLRDKLKNAIISEYVQNRHFSSQNGIRIKSLRSRHFSIIINPVLLVCFCCVCIVLFRVCIALSCKCILYKLLTVTSSRFYSALVYFLYGSFIAFYPVCIVCLIRFFGVCIIFFPVCIIFYLSRIIP